MSLFSSYFHVDSANHPLEFKFILRTLKVRTPKSFVQGISTVPPSEMAGKQTIYSRFAFCVKSDIKIIACGKGMTHRLGNAIRCHQVASVFLPLVMQHALFSD